MRGLAALFCVLPMVVPAATLELPASAKLQSAETTPLSSYDVAVGGWSFAGLPKIEALGTVDRQVWRIDSAGLTTLQILAPLRQQLQSAGFSLLYDCRTDACGGFDFRFGLDVAPPPAMQVNLGDFRYLAARRGADPAAEYVTLFISKTARAGFVQVVTVGAETATDERPIIVATAAPPAIEQPADAAPAPTGAFGSVLEASGHVILSDLKFESGSAQLGAGPFDTLAELAGYLIAHPARKVALVGHTDSSGSLEANVALSRHRAASVVERLVADYGVPRAQLEAQGMGYLAPVASNLSAQGRDANRRVEVILTSTD